MVLPRRKLQPSSMQENPAAVWRIEYKNTTVRSPVLFTNTAFPATIPLSQHLPLQDNTPRQQTS